MIRPLVGAFWACLLLVGVLTGVLRSQGAARRQNDRGTAWVVHSGRSTREDPKATPINAESSVSFTTTALGSGSTPTLSGDGRIVAFIGADGVIRVVDRTTGAASSAESASGPLALSDDGRFLAFTSSATDVVPGVNGTQVYVRDRLRGAVAVASVSTSGAPGNGPSSLLALSGDGRIVAFVSWASNLPGGLAGTPALYTRDLQLNVTRQENLDSSGTTIPLPSGGGAGPLFSAALSASGRYLAFVASVPLQGGFIFPVTVSGAGVFIRDRATGVTTGESSPFSFYSILVSMSDDARFLLATARGNINAPTHYGTSLRDLQSGATTTLGGDTLAFATRLSGDGRFVSYSTYRDYFTQGFLVTAVFDIVTGGVTELGRSRTYAGGVSRVSAGAVAFALDGTVYLATVDVPGAPTNLTAAVVGSTVTLAWQPSAGVPAERYVIEAGSAPGAADLATLSADSTAITFTATNVGAGLYYVRVRAANAAGVGPPSNEVAVNVRSSCVTPTSPTNLASVVTGSTVTLTWFPGAGVSTYWLDVGSRSGQSDVLVADLGSAAASLVATNVAAATYYVRVRAANLCGTSGPSNESVVIVR